MILAGGRSTRMGSDKASLILDGKMLIEIVVNNLKEGGFSQIVVSVRDFKQSEWIKNIFENNVETVIDSDDSKGIWDVLKFSLPSNEIVQIVSVDSPWFDGKSIRQLTSVLKRNSGKIGVVPWSKDGPEPLLMQVKSSNLLEIMSNSKPMQLRKFVNSKNFKELNWKELTNPNALKNLNYPHDLPN
ncbi:MAG: molybdenum cofactor guanylyltransferase [Candidatus Thermoplasmatota archaeon]|nr:molybdenum cofactor guanylyltransferase [Candidatus Thermoplasmatota archaeon]